MSEPTLITSRNITVEPGIVYRAVIDVPFLATKARVKHELEKEGFQNVSVWSNPGDLPADWPEGQRGNGDLGIEGTWGKPQAKTVDREKELDPAEVISFWRVSPLVEVPLGGKPPITTVAFDGYRLVANAEQVGASTGTMNVIAATAFGDRTRAALVPRGDQGAPASDWQNAMAKLDNFVIIPANFDPASQALQFIFATKSEDVTRELAPADGSGKYVALIVPESAQKKELPQPKAPSGSPGIALGAASIVLGLALLVSVKGSVR